MPETHSPIAKARRPKSEVGGFFTLHRIFNWQRFIDAKLKNEALITYFILIRQSFG